jgi:glycosyltransferase involved in cell wall biosynthesis
VRILLVNKYTKVTGGADRHCLDLAGLLIARGHSVRFLSSRGGRGDELGGAFVTPTVTHETRDRLAAAERLAVATRALFNRSAAAAMRRLISDFKPNLVQAHKLYPQLSVAPVLVAHTAGVPVVQWAHDYEFVAANPEDDSGGRFDRLESAPAFRALNSATFLVRRFVHAPRVTRWLVASQSVRSVYSEHGIECDVVELFQSPCERTPPAFEPRSGVLFTGRLTEAKGVRDVIAMAKRAPDLEITVAGMGPVHQQVEDAAESLPNLRYEGFVDQASAHRLVTAARVVVVPSRWAEPGGRVALEAMAAGTPVVAYPRGGLAEYVSNTGGGLLVAEDPAALAEASLRVSHDQELWNALSSRGLEGIRRVHSPERYMDRIESIYAEVVRRPTARKRPAITRTARPAPP